MYLSWQNGLVEQEHKRELWAEHCEIVGQKSTSLNLDSREYPAWWSMKIEVPGPEDIDKLRCVFNECRRTTAGIPSQNLTMCEFEEEIEGERVSLIRVDAEVIAFISIWEPDKFIHHLFVTPKHQRRGLGQRLIMDAEKRYGRPLYLKCGVDNTRARDFYDRTGWLAQSTESGPNGPYINYKLPAVA